MVHKFVCLKSCTFHLCVATDLTSSLTKSVKSDQKNYLQKKNEKDYFDTKMSSKQSGD